MRQKLYIAFLVLNWVMNGAAGWAAPPDPSGYIAHEWGTFTSLQGSDGVNQPGLHHEEEALPAFVHGRGKTPVQLVSRRPCDP